MVELSALVLLLGLAAEPATAPAVEAAPVGDSHERWEGATPVQGDDHAHGEGHDADHDHVHGHGFHFDFDAVRMHHTMPYPAIEWFHGKPVVIFDLKKYAAKYLDELTHDKAFAAAVATPYLDWAKGEVTLAKAMAVADGKALFSFPKALSFFNNQTFIGTIALLLLTFILFKARPKPGQVKPVGAVQHMLESVVLFIRDDVVRPNVKGPAAHGHGHDDHGHGHGHGHADAKAATSYADKWVPHFAAIFLGILAFNLVGLIPGGGTASGNPGVTVAFAVTTLVSMLLFGFKEQGFFSFWVNLVPVHWSWKPMDMLVWFLLFVIELMGLLIKPAALAIRLAANMFAGHTALLAFTTLGFIIFAANSDQGALSLGLGAVGWVVAVALYFLELLVAFIQAYIFTLLSAIFIGSSIHPEH